MLHVASPAGAAVVSVAFQLPGDVGLVAENYDPSGDSVELSLDFAPRPGTELRVVDRQNSGVRGGGRVPLPCALLGRKVVTWGSNSHGQLGDGSGAAQSTVPVLVEQSGVLAGKQVASVGAGARHSFARCSDGTLATWGDNALGQLGTDAGASSNVPGEVDTSSLPAGSRFAGAWAHVGASHTMALVASPTGGPPTLSALDEWRQAHFGTLSNVGDAADGADPNRDGEPNFVEFATSQSPRSASVTPTPHSLSPAGIAFF